jgi:hypothetical protein
MKTINVELTHEEYFILIDILEHANCDKDEQGWLNSLIKKLS